MTSHPTVIETERLVLRPYRLVRSMGYAEIATVSYAGDPVLLLVRERGAC
ncbi:hypothetical protein SAMN05660686_04419 [Thalassobaculum litoreum DSM 18839]|uniref:Uncharacterized protein n=1 Tax=Thalassobaculum litoreum DSM 18839 TaxID=1123362 RepID=A0A8G2EWU7_9PROT|nr:hypothetical protein SAMN05660686_04419 [Thalassobaculum litoreum DSM 18839]